MVRRLVAAVTLAPLLAALTACGDDATATSSGGGAGGAVETTSTTTSGPGPVAVSSGTETGTGSSGAGGANPEDPYGCLQGEAPPRPASIPEGYRPWACWSQKPQCMLWIPEDPETMVEPITWGPCAEGSPGGDGCQQMVTTWPFDAYGAIGATYPGVPQLDVSASEPLLRMMRISVLDATSGYIEYLVGEPDGPVRYSMRRPWVEGTNCGFQDYDLTGGFWVIAPYGDDSGPLNESDVDGLILVDLEEKEIALPYRENDSSSRPGWRASRSKLARSTTSKLFLHDHPFAQETLLHDAATDPLGASATAVVQVIGDGVVWEVGNSNHLGIRAFDSKLGAHDLIRYPGDLTRGAGTPGTDGVDLVWMEGTGRTPGELTYADRSMMTSPFTTDPSALIPRRLRRDLSPLFGTNGDAFKVGCGRAAKAGGASTKDVQIVRLTDGWGWNLLHSSQVWQSSRVAGLTCDEVFLVVQFWQGGKPQGSTIQRIRFDALGEGEPPD